MSHRFASLLNPVIVNKCLDQWLIEDQPAFDVQSLAISGEVCCSVYCKQSCVIAGLTFLESIASLSQISVDFLACDGENIEVTEGRKVVAKVSGPASLVLKFERLILNIISRCSGVATVTRRVKEKLKQVNWTGHLAGTRKTTPGFRFAEKYALLVGGGSGHRFDLSQMIMLKDNHIKCAGGIKMAIERVKEVGDFASKIEVECSSLDDAIEAASCGADIIMFDNFNPQDAKEAATKLKTMFPSVLIEVSGGINEKNVTDFAIQAVDIISMSCLVQGYSTIDFSMKVD